MNLRIPIFYISDQVVILAFFVAALVFTGCSTRVRSSVAIAILPDSVRNVAPAKVDAAKRALANQLRARGFVVIDDLKNADNIVHTYYWIVPKHPSIGELVEVKVDHNRARNEPIDLPPLWPRIPETSGGIDSR